MNKIGLSKPSKRFNCAYDKNGYIGVLTVAGVLTPDSLQEIGMRLEASLMNADFVVVNLDKASGIDAGFVSLFCVAAQTAHKENKRLHLGRTTPEQQTAALKLCSSNFSEAARYDCEARCFWMDQSSYGGGDAVR